MKALRGRRAIINASLQLAALRVAPSKLATSTSSMASLPFVKQTAPCVLPSATSASHLNETIERRYGTSLSLSTLQCLRDGGSGRSRSFQFVADPSQGNGTGSKFLANEVLFDHKKPRVKLSAGDGGRSRHLASLLRSPSLGDHGKGIQHIGLKDHSLISHNRKSCIVKDPSIFEQSTRWMSTMAISKSSSRSSEGALPSVSGASASSDPEGARTAEGSMPSGIGQDEGLIHSSRGPIWHHVKTKALTKQAQHIMNILNSEAVANARKRIEYPDFQPGDVLQLKVEIPENRRRIAVVKGVCIARRNAGIGSTFRIRRVLNGQGIEYLYPLYSPNLKEIKIVERRKVRRAKLYYLREKNPKFCTV